MHRPFPRARWRHGPRAQASTAELQQFEATELVPSLTGPTRRCDRVEVIYQAAAGR